MELYYYDHCTTDAEGTREVVDVGECVNVCYGWVSGFAGLRVCPHQYRQNCTIIVELYNYCDHQYETVNTVRHTSLNGWFISACYVHPLV